MTRVLFKSLKLKCPSVVAKTKSTSFRIWKGLWGLFSKPLTFPIRKYHSKIPQLYSVHSHFAKQAQQLAHAVMPRWEAGAAHGLCSGAGECMSRDSVMSTHIGSCPRCCHTPVQLVSSGLSEWRMASERTQRSHRAEHEQVFGYGDLTKGKPCRGITMAYCAQELQRVVK